MPKTPDLLDTLRTCAILGVERSTLTRWVQLGRIKPAMRVGGNGAYLFRPSEVERVRLANAPQAEQTEASA